MVTELANPSSHVDDSKKIAQRAHYQQIVHRTSYIATEFSNAVALGSGFPAIVIFRKPPVGAVPRAAFFDNRCGANAQPNYETMRMAN